MKDYGIVHLTDLHYPVDGEAHWRAPLIQALKTISSDETIEIRGVAVTGDLTDSPSEVAFKNVATFVGEVATSLKLGVKKEEQRQRVWVVDGNHDYRALGNVRISAIGIEAGGHFSRLQSTYDSVAGLYVLGINTAAKGLLARGGVAASELTRIANAEKPEVEQARQARYRIALLHHHLLPLPTKPVEHMTPGERGIDALYDPGFKLLKNGGLVTTFLLQAGFDLVLHGHEHQAFAANVSYLDVRGPRTLTVVGGVAAIQGFQVIRFCSRGGVLLERYLYTTPLGAYAPVGMVNLWSHANWQEMDWLRESRAKGRYDRFELRQSLTPIGDLTTVHDVSNIFAGTGKTLKKLDRSISTKPENLGTCGITRIFDKQHGRELRKDELPNIAPKVDYEITLMPPAQAEIGHKGFVTTSETYNGFAITAEDAKLRLQQKPVERTTFGVAYPSRDVSFKLTFPPGYAPDRVDIEVSDDERGGSLDLAETERATRHLIYEPSGTVFLNLEWVLPRHRYALSWPLPGRAQLSTPVAVTAGLERDRLLGLHPNEVDALCNGLCVVRDEICGAKDHLGCNSAGCRQIELGLFAFDARVSHLVWISGTHSASSPFRTGRLPWGVGIRGLTMRRRLPHFASSAEVSQGSILYRPPSGCPVETYILCVPIPLPRGRAAEPEILGNPALPCLVASLSTQEPISNLRHLSTESTCEAVSLLILKSCLDKLNDLALE